jgi:hypothetical protein
MMGFVRAWRARHRDRHVLTWDDAIMVVSRQREIAIRNASLMRDARASGTAADTWTARALACAFVLRELERATAAHALGARS